MTKFETKYATIQFALDKVRVTATPEGIEMADNMYELLEDFISNSGFAYLTADSLNALSEAPILIEGHWDDGGNKFVQTGDAYVFAGYLVYDEFDLACRPTGVIFNKLQ